MNKEDIICSNKQKGVKEGMKGKEGRLGSNFP